MAVVPAKPNLWEAVRGRRPGTPTGPADADLWQAVQDRLNPAKARPRLRNGIEHAELTSLRGEPYVMLRSPGPDAAYLRLSPDEVALTRLMDGSRSVAVLVGELAKIAGQLAPDRVLRLVADLAGNRMLEELPLDVFEPLRRARNRHLAFPARIGKSLVRAATGRRMVLANPDRLAGFLYRAGGRFLFTAPAALLIAAVVVAGFGTFVWTWIGGAQSVFLVGGSYAWGALVLLGLNVVALACHEFGHAMAAKHAGRRVPAAGVLLYFGLPSVFVDTTDVWMAGRRARLLTSLAGPVAALTMAGTLQLIALAYPPLAPLAFKIAFVWYLNSLFNLNPLIALDGYYAFMDWLELPNLRPRAIATLVSWVRHRRPRWADLDREGRLIALYALLASVWLIVMVNLMIRMYRDRVTGVVTGLWNAGLVAQLLLTAIAAGLISPVLYAVAGGLSRRWRRLKERIAQRRRERDLPRRFDAIATSVLRTVDPARLRTLAASSRWLHPRTGSPALAAQHAPGDVLLVVEGRLEARRPGDPPGTIRARVGTGELAGAAAVLVGGASTLTWTAAGTSAGASGPAYNVGGSAAGTRLLAIPAQEFASLLGPVAASSGLRTDGGVVSQDGFAPPPIGGDTAPGVHAGGGYPPLAGRPAPPVHGDDRDDRRRTRWLLILLLALIGLALFTGRVAAADPQPWAEMPRDQALLSVNRGEATAMIDGRDVLLEHGDERHLHAGDAVATGELSGASLTFFGGGTVRICAQSDVAIETVRAAGFGPVQPAAALALDHGMAVADTEPSTAAIDPVVLTMDVRQRTVVNDGPAGYSVAVSGNPVRVESGTVLLDGRELPVTGPVGCPGDPTSPVGSAADEPSGGPTPTTSPEPSATPDPTPSPTPSPTPTPTLPPPPPPPPDPSPTPTEPPPPPPPPPNEPPEITRAVASSPAIDPVDNPQCPKPETSRIAVAVTDAESSPDELDVAIDYVLDTDDSIAGQLAVTADGSGGFRATLGPFAFLEVPTSGGVFTVTVTAIDPDGGSATAEVRVALAECEPEG